MVNKLKKKTFGSIPCNDIFRPRGALYPEKVPEFQPETKQTFWHSFKQHGGFQRVAMPNEKQISNQIKLIIFFLNSSRRTEGLFLTREDILGGDTSC